MEPPKLKLAERSSRQRFLDFFATTVKALYMRNSCYIFQEKIKACELEQPYSFDLQGEFISVIYTPVNPASYQKF